jgi:hypothetical protein
MAEIYGWRWLFVRLFQTRLLCTFAARFAIAEKDTYCSTMAANEAPFFASLSILSKQSMAWLSVVSALLVVGITIMIISSEKKYCPHEFLPENESVSIPMLRLKIDLVKWDTRKTGLGQSFLLIIVVKQLLLRSRFQADCVSSSSSTTIQLPRSSIRLTQLPGQRECFL